MKKTIPILILIFITLTFQTINNFSQSQFWSSTTTTTVVTTTTSAPILFYTPTLVSTPILTPLPSPASTATSTPILTPLPSPAPTATSTPTPTPGISKCEDLPPNNCTQGLCNNILTTCLTYTNTNGNPYCSCPKFCEGLSLDNCTQGVCPDSTGNSVITSCVVYDSLGTKYCGCPKPCGNLSISECKQGFCKDSTSNDILTTCLVYDQGSDHPYCTCPEECEKISQPVNCKEGLCKNPQGELVFTYCKPPQPPNYECKCTETCEKLPPDKCSEGGNCKNGWSYCVKTNDVCSCPTCEELTITEAGSNGENCSKGTCPNNQSCIKNPDFPGLYPNPCSCTQKCDEIKDPQGKECELGICDDLEEKACEKFTTTINEIEKNYCSCSKIHCPSSISTDKMPCENRYCKNEENEGYECLDLKEGGCYCGRPCGKANPPDCFLGSCPNNNACQEVLINPDNPTAGTKCSCSDKIGCDSAAKDVAPPCKDRACSRLYEECTDHQTLNECWCRTPCDKLKPKPGFHCYAGLCPDDHPCQEVLINPDDPTAGTKCSCSDKIRCDSDIAKDVTPCGNRACSRLYEECLDSPTGEGCWCRLPCDKANPPYCDGFCPPYKHCRKVPIDPNDPEKGEKCDCKY